MKKIYSKLIFFDKELIFKGEDLNKSISLFIQSSNLSFLIDYLKLNFMNK
jgi:hypothetical protein